ncbi:MAG: methylated-DNA--[protein]-cysteine S-methyltransferase [Actinomycetota bacterium]
MRDLGAELGRAVADGNQMSRAATGSFVARADASGLVDVAYSTHESPFGPLLLAASRHGLVRLAYPDERVGVVLDALAERVSPRLLHVPGRLDEARRQLDDYFEGRRTDFSLAVDLRLVSPFGRRVLTRTRAIAYGATASYREVAAGSGNPRAVRATGTALGRNPVPIVVPCHRVVRSSGDLGGYTGGLERKRKLLELEGVLG